jgi:glycosyltransferase involved in cell wall biosynthesis
MELFECSSDLSKVAGEDVHLVINHLPGVAEKLLDELLGVSNRLGIRILSSSIVTIFETESIPRGWLANLMRFDRVVVPTEFNRKTFSHAGVPMNKLVVVPYCVDTDFFHPAESSCCDRINITYVFDFSHRKGVDLLLEAYGLLRGLSDAVVLTLKAPGFVGSSGSWLLGFVEDAVRRRFGSTGLAGYPRIQIDIGSIHVDRLRDLYWGTDLYVSTDRASGWGMPALEAMACGVPVSAIEYSGGAEFISEDNGYPIKTTGKLVSVDGRLVDEIPIYEGHSWGDVSTSAVVEALSAAILDPLRSRKAALARSTAEMYSFAVVGELLFSSLFEC